MSYNGWTNYETWNVALWMDNGDYNGAERAEEIMKDVEYDKDEATRRFADEIEDFYKNEMFPADIQGTYADLLGAALSEVDWYEIAEHYVDDVEIPKEENAIEVQKGDDHV